MQTLLDRTVFKRVRLVSITAILVTVVVSKGLESLFGSGSQYWQVWLAVVALAVGIPHGALDHLITVPSMHAKQMTIFVIKYLAVVFVVIAAILVWPLWGFLFVLVMSAVHFGMGDASFIRQGNPIELSNKTPWWVYAIPAGLVPIVIPLTQAGSPEAIRLVNPQLLDWHFGYDELFFRISLIAGLISITWLMLAKNYRDARDIAVLLLLVLTTPPLVAFAAYFGFWHALRHTARLSLEFPSARKELIKGRWLNSLWRVTLPGIPALIGTMLAAAVITYLGGWQINSYIWVTLVVVWALTVPHMALTWRLDQKVLITSKND
jgi:Brp/Blh family beta-carotene 15,15'-monooxygenase